MWKNVENCLILLFEIALVVTVITQIGILKVLAMVVLFPMMVFLSMLTGSDSPGGDDLVLTGETILIWLQSNSRTYLMYFTYVMVTACWMAAYLWNETIFGAIAICILIIYMPRYGKSIFVKES
ncbi:MAG: hypothetical protein K6F57_01995 [Candidatus Saccharibacteria bacterium]|nr:hypothetical protein [Candidatus Saccharibacteria bacterium]